MSRDPYDERGASGPESRGERDQEDDTFAEVLNRFSFDSGRSRRKKRSRRDPEPPRRDPQPPPESDQEPSHEPFPEQDPLDQFPAGRGWPEQPPPEQEPPGSAIPGQRPEFAGPSASSPDLFGTGSSGDLFTAPEQRQPPQPDPEPVEDTSIASNIRPYAWTGGRTKSNQQFEMETLVSTSEGYRPSAMLRGEHQSIAEMCRHPRSVAEVGALLSVPLGVAKVLLADMAELGLITVHQTVTESGSAPHLNLMERVLSGLRRL